MKLYALPPRIRGFIFDLDCTLYTHTLYARNQFEVLYARLAGKHGLSPEAMETEVEKYRTDWSATHDGKKISLGNAFVHFGVSITESVLWREELIHPENYLTPDARLRETLSSLAGHAALALVTNNPASTGRRTLAALGVLDYFATVIGLDTCGVSKPHREPFQKALDALGLPVSSCVSVGDRYELDIALPLEMGMGGILVDGVADVYALPEELEARLDASGLPCESSFT